VASKFSVQQNAGSVTPPVGFTNYLGVTSLSAYSITSTARFVVQYRGEGYSTSDLNWGAANASPVTLSLWVRSSLTGSFGGSLMNASTNRSYPFLYAVSAANTWELKTITVPGDTTGTWGTGNGEGVRLTFGLGNGSTESATAGAWASGFFLSATGATSVVGTSGATFYITGVQLEKGSTATAFDYRPYTTELALCQRYFFKWTGTNFATYTVGYGEDTTQSTQHIIFPVQMRTTPTMAISGANRISPGPVSVTTSTINYSQLGNFGGYFGFTCAGVVTLNKFYIFGANNDASAFLSGSAEL
jgi:hypothetical protein